MTNIILEYSYDQPTLIISRAIIDRFKSYIRDEEDPGLTIELGEFDILGRLLPVRIQFVESRSIHVNGIVNQHGIAFSIGYRPTSIKQDFNQLIAEIKDAVRHELEHVGQVLKPGKAMITGSSSPKKLSSTKGLLQYYLADHEVEAHVKGLLKKAKTNRTPLSLEIEKFISGLEKHLPQGGADLVRQKYGDYARKHLQKYENTMNRVSSFSEWQKVNEANGIKALVGKEAGEDLTVQDAKVIGRKISKMEGKDRQKYIGIVNFMGASCKVFNEIWANYKTVDGEPKSETENNDKEYEKPGVPSSE